jgi:hypothetical protein
MNWAYIIIGGAAAEISLLMLIYHLTARRSDGAIKALESHNKWLKEQLEQANDNAPDIVVERQKRRVEQYREELEQLSKDYEANTILIQQKERDLEHAQKLLSELEYYREQFGCPYCGAELTILGGGEEDLRVFACGYVTGLAENPCPYDPEFPKLEEYELQTKYDQNQGLWFCFPKEKTKNAKKLSLDNRFGKTEEEAKQRVVEEYKFHIRNVPNERSNLLLGLLDKP